MKYKRFTIIPAAVLCLILFAVFSPIRLIKQADRKSRYELTPQEKEAIEHTARATSVDEAMNWSMEYVCKQLRFALKNDLPGGKANCIGYAQHYAAVFNYCCEVEHIPASARPVVGYVKIWGINICSALEQIMPSQQGKNFVKDHDFVEVRTPEYILYIDASINDLIGRRCITKQEIQPNQVHK